MCRAFQELDIRSRAAASIVDDWQCTIVPPAEAAGTPEGKGRKQVRNAWKLDALIDLIFEAAEQSAKIPEICESIKPKDAVNDDEVSAAVSQLDAFAESLRRLIAAISGAIAILEAFESQNVKLSRSSNELRERLKEIGDMLAHVENFSEALEWRELEHTAISSDRIRAVAEYMRSTGQASA